MIAYCLADFFNLDIWRSGGPPTHSDIRIGLEDLVAATLKSIADTGVTASELVIRLYGGWYGERLDDRVLVRELTAAVIADFPRSGRTRLRIQIAEAPIWDPSIRLLRTLRRIPQRSTGLTISTPRICPKKGSCSIDLLASWMKGRCPDGSCSAKLPDVATANRQKMVDTLLTVDALAIVRDQMADILVIASDDDDLVPAFLAVTSADISVIRLMRNSAADVYYDGILEMRDLTTYIW